MLIVAYLLLLLPWTVDASCDRDIGPSGSVDCRRITRYNSSQWGTCLTDVYIQEKSKGQHKCEDRTRTYCYYQCMLEVHGENSGEVTTDCECDSGDPVPTQGPLETTMDPICYSPSGTDCSWYKECLEKKIPCEGTQDGYAIEYAEKFCGLFQEHLHTLSYVGQRWVNATRKCLQVSLVPSIRPFEQSTCSYVKKLAFEAHSDCYLSPYPGAPSICDLSPSDMWTVFWTIKSAFVSDFQESLLGMLEVGWGCVGWKINSICNTVTALLEVTVTLLPVHLRFKRSADLSRLHSQSAFFASAGHDVQNFEQGLFSVDAYHENAATKKRSIGPQNDQGNQGAELRQETEVHGTSRHRARRQSPAKNQTGETDLELHYHMLAAELCQSMARQLDWASKGLIWFAYGEKSDDSLVAKILLADKQTYGLGTGIPGTQRNLTSAVGQAAVEFAGGKLRISLNGTRIQLGTLSACEDVDCQQVSFIVTASAPEKTSSGQPALSHWAMLLLLAITGAAVRFASAPLCDGN